MKIIVGITNYEENENTRRINSRCTLRACANLVTVELCSLLIDCEPWMRKKLSEWHSPFRLVDEQSWHEMSGSLADVRRQNVFALHDFTIGDIIVAVVKRSRSNKHCEQEVNSVFCTECRWKKKLLTFICENSEAPQVNSLGMSLSLNHLRRQIVNSSAKGCTNRVGLMNTPSEVSNLQLIFLAEK